MSHAINVKEANVNTVSIEINALKIGKKQVTMGVFRQLENESIINFETMELKGIPWGKVNYWPKPCNDDHLHIVWQKGKELKRACVFKNIYGFIRKSVYKEEVKSVYDELNNLTSDYAMCYLYKLKKEGKDFNFRNNRFSTYVDDFKLTFDSWISNNPNYRPHEGFYNIMTSTYYGFLEKEFEEYYSEELSHSTEELRILFHNNNTNLKVYMKKYEVIYEQLKVLEQLFIAV